MYPSHRKRSLSSVGKQNENFNEHFSQDLLMSTPHMERNSYSYIHPSVLKKKSPLLHNFQNVFQWDNTLHVLNLKASPEHFPSYKWPQVLFSEAGPTADEAAGGVSCGTRWHTYGIRWARVKECETQALFTSTYSDRSGKHVEKPRGSWEDSCHFSLPHFFPFRDQDGRKLQKQCP